MTVDERAGDDHRIAAVLAARSRMADAFRSRNIDALDELFASDLVVHAPNNRVLDRADVLDRFRRGQIHTNDGPVTSTVEFAGTRDDLVVIMGHETIEPMVDTSHAGVTVHRRFTDIWRTHGADWQLAVRQATIIHTDS